MGNVTAPQFPHNPARIRLCFGPGFMQPHDLTLPRFNDGAAAIFFPPHLHRHSYKLPSRLLLGAISMKRAVVRLAILRANSNLVISINYYAALMKAPPFPSRIYMGQCACSTRPNTVCSQGMWRTN
jgi:hypothetical protein